MGKAKKKKNPKDKRNLSYVTYQMLSANKSLSNTVLLKAADAAAEFLYQKGRNLCGDQNLTL